MLVCCSGHFNIIVCPITIIDNISGYIKIKIITAIIIFDRSVIGYIAVYSQSEI